MAAASLGQKSIQSIRVLGVIKDQQPFPVLPQPALYSIHGLVWRIHFGQTQELLPG